MYFAFSDVETTGLRHDDKIVEVAWIITDESLNEIERKGSFINPERKISEAASKINGIFDHTVASSPTIDQFMAEHGGLFTSDDVIFAAHNAKFDLRFLGGYLRDKSRSACTLRLARKHIKDVDNHKLQTLRCHYQLESGEAHRAIGDVVTLLSLYRKLCEITGMNPRELAEDAAKPVLVETIGFGAHKGKRLRNLPPDYRAWLLSLDDLDEDLRYSLKML